MVPLAGSVSFIRQVAVSESTFMVAMDPPLCWFGSVGLGAGYIGVELKICGWVPHPLLWPSRWVWTLVYMTSSRIEMHIVRHTRGRWKVRRPDVISDVDHRASGASSGSYFTNWRWSGPRAARIHVVAMFEKTRVIWIVSVDGVVGVLVDVSMTLSTTSIKQTIIEHLINCTSSAHQSTNIDQHWSAGEHWQKIKYPFRHRSGNDCAVSNWAIIEAELS